MKNMRINIKIIIFGILTLFMNISCLSQKQEYSSGFYDFISEFSQGEAKQTDNISFPLLFISDNDTSFIQKYDWKNIDYCFGCEFSPLLFMGDSMNRNDEFYTVNEKNNYIIISLYIKPENKIQNFCFSKLKDSWFLTKIEVRTMKSFDKESFFDFLNRFATDTNFIKTRITKDTKYITWEENSNELIESTIDIKSLAGDDYLFERIYIKNFDLEVDNVELYIKGEGTGYHLEYFYKKIAGNWYLIKLVNIGV